ncbi:MAG: ATP-dependent 6-phosphofructokinase [bacterium]
MNKKVGILNSGGDCPGLNTVISAIVRRGLQLGYEFIGFEKGWEGILSPMSYFDLNLERIRGISHLSGTILRTVNKGRFAGKAGTGNFNVIPPEILLEAKNNLRNIGIDSLIVIGGDGTLSGAMQLADIGVNIVGIPKSIDNDLNLTDMTFGFSTSANVVSESLTKIHPTAESHERVFIVETMGRFAGWIALYGGLGGGAQCILIPEIPFKTEKIIEFLRKRKSLNRLSTIIVIAEGAKEKNMESLISTDIHASEIVLGGISQYLEKRINKLAPEEFDVRTLILGHLQRGGTPLVLDRILAIRYGIHAIEALDQGKFGEMVALNGNDITTVKIVDAVKTLRIIPQDSDIIHSARSIDVCFGD